MPSRSKVKGTTLQATFLVFDPLRSQVPVTGGELSLCFSCSVGAGQQVDGQFLFIFNCFKVYLKPKAAF